MSGGTEIDPAALIIALSALITAVGGTVLSRRGKRNEDQQQSAANELQSKAQNHDYYRDLVQDHRAEIDRLQDEISEARVQLTRERLEHRGEMSHMRDIVATLRDVVHSEIAQFIADDGINGSPPVVAIEHVSTPEPEDPHVQ